MLVRRGRLEEDAAAGLLSWRHSGFSVHHAIRVEPDDTAGVERLCRYLVHPPIALGRLMYDGVRAGYRGRRVHPVSGARRASPSTHWRCWRGCASTSRRRGCI